MVWVQLTLLACALAATSLVRAATPAPANVFSDELAIERYNCDVELQPAATLGTRDAVRLFFDWANARTYTQVSVGKNKLVIDAVRGGRKLAVTTVPIAVTPGAAYHLRILRRQGQLRVEHDAQTLFRGFVPRADDGAQAGYAADKRWTVTSTRVQRLEPVIFTDDFMRAQDTPGPWSTVQGEWALRSAWDDDPHGNSRRFSNIIYSQNPFAWSGRNRDGAALSTAGELYWEDYTLSASVQPGATAVGLLVNYQDAQHGLLVRWSAASAKDPRGDLLQVLQLTTGEPRVLAEAPGGYLPDHWYRLSAAAVDGTLTVSVDGKVQLTVKDIAPTAGKVGLYAEGATGGVFDDVAVFGSDVKLDIIAQRSQEQIAQRFQIDKNGMAEWADQQNDWAMSKTIPQRGFFTTDTYGDQGIALTCTPDHAKTGKLTLTLGSDGADITTGDRAQATLAENGDLRYTLYHDGTLLATAKGKTLEPGSEHRLRLSRREGVLRLEVDEDEVVRADVKAPLTGLRAGFQGEGCFINANLPTVTSRNMLDYPFADAPVDWRMEGTWETTARWACSPNWSFLAGWSRGDAVLWHKKRFTGDQTFEAYEGLKMEYAREEEIYDNRYRDFGITICGDGDNPRTGYTGVYAEVTDKPRPADNATKQAQLATARITRRIVLYRNGVEVGAQDILAPPNRGHDHRAWFTVALRKHGNVVEFWAEGALAVTYTDSQPIDGGYPAVWSTNNGVSVARARLFYANPPETVTRPQVTLELPWYPEWANVGRPLKVDLQNMCSTSKKPLRLEVTPRLTPEGETGGVAVAGAQLTFTAAKTGKHWYQLRATDGEVSSPREHLVLPVFNPALKRDDTHALVLYRFDEGDGFTVHDRSSMGTPLDLTLDPAAQAVWLPGQGLKLPQETAAPLKSTGNATKLLSLVKTNAATLEFWISGNTIYPANPGGWIGAFLCWENSPTQRNFATCQGSEWLVFSPPGVKLVTGEDRFYVYGHRVGLEHVMVTWDGVTSCIYLNGNKIIEKPFAWSPNLWTDAPLYVGNQSDGIYGFVGAFYLVAIHDRCFTTAEVLKQYQAGPSAQ